MDTPGGRTPALSTGGQGAPRRHRLPMLAAVLLALSGSPPALLAQEIHLGTSGAWGDGPTPAAAIGLDVRVGMPWVSVVGEVSSWGSRGVDCAQMIPGSYRCDVGGRALFAGARVVPPMTWAVLPYMEGKVGSFGESPVRSTPRPAAQSFEIGASLQLTDRLALDLGGRRVWVDDGAYEAALGEKVRYTMFNVRFVARVR